MDKDRVKRRRRVFIAIISLLMASGILVVGETLRQVTASNLKNGTPEVHEMRALQGDLAGEYGVFRGLTQGSRLTQVPKGAAIRSRSLAEFYGRRAYSGAPPAIPHAVDSDLEDPAQRSCIGCHAEGGYVPRFNAFAPVTPHPEFRNCRQCHVPRKEVPLFKETQWASLSAPKIGVSALISSPPPIPHEVRFRSNCLACHTGPGAVAEIRSPHPDRVNCRQCHVPNLDDTREGVWIRQANAK